MYEDFKNEISSKNLAFKKDLENKESITYKVLQNRNVGKFYRFDIDADRNQKIN